MLESARIADLDVEDLNLDGAIELELNGEDNIWVEDLPKSPKAGAGKSTVFAKTTENWTPGIPKIPKIPAISDKKASPYGKPMMPQLQMSPFHWHPDKVSTSRTTNNPLSGGSTKIKSLMGDK